ncbi:MAG: GTPase associated protein [Pseudomonadota bacterium]
MAAAAEESVELMDAAPDVESIIRTHSYYAAGSGLIAIPAVDMLAATTIQLRMIAKLCEAHGVAFSDQAVKSTLAAIVTGGLPRLTVGYPLMSAAKSVPVVGTLLGVATLPALNGAVTYALGKAFDWHFGRGGTLLDVDTKEMAEKVGEEIQAGKAAVSKAVSGSKATAKAGA